MDAKTAKLENIENSNDKPRNKYDPEFKRQVIDVWHSGAYATVVECAKSYGINDNTLHSWLHDARKSPIITETNAEIIKLKKELSKTKMELEILKKAAIYFANHAR